MEPGATVYTERERMPTQNPNNPQRPGLQAWHLGDPNQFLVQDAETGDLYVMDRETLWDLIRRNAEWILNHGG